MPSSEQSLIVIMTTLPDMEQASNIAKILVEEGLAVCVQVMPRMTSIYRWQGEVCIEPEHLVLIKAIATQYDALANRLKSLHPYEIPEIIAMPAIAVDLDYLNWAMLSTSLK